ncbi:hypothetical protein RintRC_1642 [Richelia intracellularis]|nr:hypothetical protein RintRC_1642 [Richelia intracellularis]
MKRFLIASLETLLLTIAATLAFAKEVAGNSQVSQNQVTRKFQPFNLVFLAYQQGYLQEQGIRRNGAFVNSMRQEKINVKDLVQSAIYLGILSPDTINDVSYINHIPHLILK